MYKIGAMLAVYGFPLFFIGLWLSWFLREPFTALGLLLFFWGSSIVFWAADKVLLKII